MMLSAGAKTKHKSQGRLDVVLDNRLSSNNTTSSRPEISWHARFCWSSSAPFGELGFVAF